jgi:GT2 family glycosyltransferase/glycosyltransferase involved in cell wall biosynthesis
MHGMTRSEVATLPTPPRATERPACTPGNVCLVTWEIAGPSRNGGIGTACDALAELLTSAGHDVTVLYCPGRDTEPPSPRHWQDAFASRGVRFVPLPEPAVPLGGPDHLARSYRVYEWLRGHSFDLVHFHEWLGLGYYALLAKRQGLAFAGTTFCVGVHSPSRWVREANRRFPDSFDDLEVDALERHCVAWADAVWSPSRYLLDWMSERGWELPAERIVLPYPLPSAGGPSADRGVRELVFFGRLEVRKGLALFCDALDRLATSDRPSPFSVTFLGKPAAVDGEPAGDYLRRRGERWPFPWNTLDRCTRAEALAYLRGLGRLAVMPSLVDNSPWTVLECLQAGVPFLASEVGGIPEAVAAADRPRVLFPPEPDALAGLLHKALQFGVPPALPAVDQRSNRAAWRDWHAARLRAPVRRELPDEGAPLVSVCLVHHDRPALLRQAVDSLRAQDYPNFEVVLVDDGSDLPEARAFLGELEPEFARRRWKLVRQPNRYLGAARNRAAREAGGEYLLFMDDDNVARPHELSTLVRVARCTRADVVTSLMDLFGGDDPPSAERIQARWLFSAAGALTGVVRNAFGDANALVRRAAFERLGGFTEERGVTHEDWEFFARAALAGCRVEVVPEALFWYRVGPGSMIRSTCPYANALRHLRPYLDELPADFRDLALLAYGQAQRLQSQDVQLAELRARLAARRYRVADALRSFVRRIPLVNRLLGGTAP